MFKGSNTQGWWDFFFENFKIQAVKFDKIECKNLLKLKHPSLMKFNYISSYSRAAMPDEVNSKFSEWFVNIRKLKHIRLMRLGSNIWKFKQYSENLATYTDKFLKYLYAQDTNACFPSKKLLTNFV